MVLAEFQCSFMMALQNSKVQSRLLAFSLQPAVEISSNVGLIKQIVNDLGNWTIGHFLPHSLSTGDNGDDAPLRKSIALSLRPCHAAH